MVAIFPTSPSIRAKTLEREINEIAAALHRKQQVKNIETRLNAIAHNLGQVEVSPQQKRLREDLLAVAAAAGIFLSVATVSHINDSYFRPAVAPVAVMQIEGSAGVRAESKVSTPNVVRVEPKTEVRSNSDQKIIALMHSIIGQESAGKFNIVNPHSGALGYGQVMPENVKPWTLEALGRSLTPEEFLQSPKMQLKVIKYQLTKAYNSQAVAGRSEEEVMRRVAAIWYSGQSKLWNNTKPQYYNGHPYPSIAEYTASVYQKYQAEQKTSSGVRTEVEAQVPNELRTETKTITPNVIRAEAKPETPRGVRTEAIPAKTGIGNLLLNFFSPPRKAEAAATTSVASKIVSNAKAWKGRHYKEGERARCADFVRNILRESGVNVGVTTKPVDADKEGDGRNPYLAQSFFGSDIGELIWDKKQLKPGDLVAFKDTYGNYKKGTITHVGIYVGNNMMVDRSTSSNPVFHRSLDTFKFLVGVRPHSYN